MLAQALGQHRINLREVIRVSVVIYDLLFLHTAYDAETLVEELRQGLKV